MQTKESACTALRVRGWRREAGFSLIEMIGVLAVIGILAGLMLPRVMATVTQAKVNTAAAGLSTVRSAAMTYFTKYGVFGDTNGAPISFGGADATNWDLKVLMVEQLLERPLGVPMGTNASIQLMQALPSGTLPTGANQAFNLDGASTLPNDAGVGAVVLVAVFNGVDLEEARELNRALDGPAAAMGEDTFGHDLGGRVKYDFAGAQSADVWVYLVHH